MRTHLECVPCFVRQALEAVRKTTEDQAMQEEVLRRVLHAVSEMDLRLSPPVMGQRIHRTIRALTDDPDPYREAKERTNRLAMGLLPEIRERIQAASDPLEMAVRMAIAGNVIDFGVGSHIDEAVLRQTIARMATAPLDGDFGAFTREATAAKSILYLADNAGEIVIDRLLIEELEPSRVTVAVRGGPVLNDALRADAEAAGLERLVEIIDNGSDAPGTILEDCTGEFRERFSNAGMVIAKGQGNYETLSNAIRPVWFVLMAKCAVIARNIGCEPGSLVLQRRSADSRTAVCC